ncbi:MAG: carbohydrate kinase family protein [Candidatus Micrarchaeota archaeon]
MKILFVGSALVDVVARMHDPEEISIRHGSREGNLFEKLVCVNLGSKSELDSIDLRFGGSAANAAVAARCAGAQARILTAVGKDEFGRLVKKDLKAHGIGGKVVEDGRLPTAASIVLLAKGEKSSLTFKGALANLSQNHVTPQLVEWSDAVFITSLTSEGNMRAVKKLITLVKRCGKPVVFAPSMTMLNAQLDAVRAMRGGFDVVIMNDEEAVKLTCRNNLREMLENLPGNVKVVTRGARGAVGTDGNKVVSIHSAAGRVVDATGAGDAFAGVFAQSHLAGETLETALKMATAAAAIKMTRVGAHLKCTRSEITAAARKLKTKGGAAS